VGVEAGLVLGNAKIFMMDETQPRRAPPIESLYQAACAYALIAVDLCNQDKE
jgi:hypothetical protein